MTLPSTLLHQLVHLLLPVMTTQAEQEAWLAQAFAPSDPARHPVIDGSGRSQNFASQCVDHLLKVGCPAGVDTHPLAVLLRTIRASVGPSQQAEIDALIPQLDALCEPASSGRSNTADRRSGIFISYARSDYALVHNLKVDLERAGHSCWVDVSSIQGGDAWMRAIVQGVMDADAVIVVVSARSLKSKWVNRETLYADNLDKYIIPVLAEPVDLPFILIDRHAIALYQQYDQNLPALLQALSAPSRIHAVPAVPAISSARAAELQYLETVRFEAFNFEQSTNLAGTPAADQTFVVGDEHASSYTVNDVLNELRTLKRVLLLGEAGTGKTRLLWHLVQQLYPAASTDPAAPLPLLVRLTNWQPDRQPLREFMVDALSSLHVHVETLLHTGRAVLLFDGFNEIASRDYAGAWQQIEQLAAQFPAVSIIVTSRVLPELTAQTFSRILIVPLDPLQIRQFIVQRLGQAIGEDVFWRLLPVDAAAYERRFASRFANQIADWRTVFWLHQQLPAGIRWEQDVTAGRTYSWRQWLALRDAPDHLLQLVRNPFLLHILTQVYAAAGGKLPSNRSLLLEQFVNTLLLQDGLAHTAPHTHQLQITPAGQQVIERLAALAFVMQTTDDKYGTGFRSALPMAQAVQVVDPALLAQAADAGLILPGEDVRFPHQLLQAYFAARYIAGALQAGQGRKLVLWRSPQWWEYAHWEETLLLAAGLFPGDCSPLITWLAPLHPELAARCIQQCDTTFSEVLLKELGEQWQSRLSKPDLSLPPVGRAALGRALGLPVLRGQMLDRRPGVGVDSRGIPDIAWAFVPARAVTTAEASGERRTSFHIARCPVTYAQYEAFVNADGYTQRDWWTETGWAWREDRLHPAHCWGDPHWHIGNHPVIGITWYEAAAFCRWLTAQYQSRDLFAPLLQGTGLGGINTRLPALQPLSIRLPKQHEWIAAASSGHTSAYPWGGSFSPDRCNTSHSGFGRTTAVGIYPEGNTPATAIADLAGNIWEWCATPWETNPASPPAYVLHGGSWYDDKEQVRLTARQGLPPFYCLSTIGFRVVAALTSTLASS